MKNCPARALSRSSAHAADLHRDDARRLLDHALHPQPVAQRCGHAGSAIRNTTIAPSVAMYSAYQ